MSFYDAIRVGASGAADFEIERSLRFNSGDSAHLTRTPSSATNRQTFTFSFWFKLVKVGTVAYLFECGDSDDNGERLYIRVDTDSSFSVGEKSIYRLITTQKLRDPSAWYHIVFAVDTTNSTPDNRNRLYINGEEVTSFGTRNSFSQNYNTGVNNNSLHNWGRSDIDSNYANAYLAEINFIDGQQLTPSSFGETNAETGQWVPINTSGLTYGTNGYRLKFADNSGTTATTLGKDSSGNGNNFTPNNFSVSAGAGNDSLEDTPTNNWCTWNVLSKDGGTTLSNGNLDISSANYGNNTATFFVTSGKWYWEGVGTGYVGAICGVDGQNFATSISGSGSNSIGYWSGNGYAYWGGGSTGSGTTFSSSDVVGIALDMDNGTVKFYKNNTLIHNLTFGSGTIPDLSAGVFPVYNNGTIGTTFTAVHNFGQRAFSYTPPTGYKALNSANLPDPTILLPNKHFDTLLWSGNATTSDRSITGLNFQPDWAWTKTRNFAYHHALFDAVRGPSNRLNADQNYTENFTNGGYLASFDSNGITWDYGTGNEWWNISGYNYLSWNWNAGDTDGKTYTVKVVSDSGNKYRFDNFGTSAVTLDLAEGGTYTFDQSDSSMSSHPMQLSTTVNGTHGGGSAYSTGVTYQLDGSTVTASAFISGFSSASSRKLIITVAASAPTLNYYCYYHSGMGGVINTNSTLGSSNFDGTIQSTVKANTTAGFSIVSYEGNNTQGATVGHGLGVAPAVVIVKNRESSYNWAVWHTGLLSAAYVLNLNLNSAQGSVPGIFNSTLPTSTVFSLGGGSQGDRFLSNEPNKDFIAYIFSEVAGYSKFGKYVGNGDSENGAFVFTGFRPAWIMFKNVNTGTWWFIYDVKRETFNVMNTPLAANEDDQEYSDSHYEIDILSNGFKIRGQQPEINKSGDTIVYFSFAESPFKNSRAR